MANWKQKDHITDEGIDLVNLDIVIIAMPETKWSKRDFISKHACGICGVGKLMKQWKIREKGPTIFGIRLIEI
jgi:hypothetical protein